MASYKELADLIFPDVKDKEYHDFIQTDVWDGKEFITFNYFTAEFNETEISINYDAYKSALINNY